jgi:hypothetical protein
MNGLEFGKMKVTFDSPFIQANFAQHLPTLPSELNLSGIDLISKKTFKELFIDAQSKNLPYYLFVTIPKKDNNLESLILDASHLLKNKSRYKILLEKLHYILLDCFKYSDGILTKIEFDSLNRCHYFHSIPPIQVNADISKLRTTIIQALTTSIFFENQEESKVKSYFLFSNVIQQLTAYHHKNRKINSNLTPENWLKQSGYGEYCHTLGPMLEKYFEEEKIKFTNLEKSSQNELTKWNKIFAIHYNKVEIEESAAIM